MIAAYLIGLPGAGKSTLMRLLTDGLDVAWERRPFAHARYYDDDRLIGAQIGGHHPEFPGTDRLSMAVQPKAIAWVAGRPAPVVLGEGDRLATAGFLDALAAAADRFDLVWLDTAPADAAARAAARGSTQNEQWRRGRETKVRRLVEARAHVRLDGALSPTDLVAVARARVPAFATIGTSVGVDPPP